MPFYKHHIYPHLVDRLGNPPPIEKLRRHLVPLAEGTVLEIGVGSGANFPHYDPARVNKLYALEPNPGMVRRAEKRRAQTRLVIKFVDLPGERIPLGDSSVDTVVSTFTLCTIPGVVEAIQGVGRVLKPGGKFVFFEHGISPEPSVRRWQEFTEPFFQWAFEGCHVTRDIPSLIREGGFKIEQMDTGYLAPFPKCGSYCFWGVARLASGKIVAARSADITSSQGRLIGPSRL
jgi:SAM-dependent methyltransferase